MQYMRNPALGGAEELKDASNVALVMVTATVPAGGARQGDQLDCHVSSIGAAKSLAGGRLFLGRLARARHRQPASLRLRRRVAAPRRSGDRRRSAAFTTAAGWKKTSSIRSSSNDRITLVLDRNHADFEVAQEVAEMINSQLSIQSGDGDCRPRRSTR